MNKRLSSKLLTPLLLASLIWGCKRELSTNWDAEYALPIAHAEMDLGDLVGDSLLVKKGDNSLDLVYNYQLAVDSINKYLEVPDTLQNKSVTLSKIVSYRPFLPPFLLNKNGLIITFSPL